MRHHNLPVPKRQIPKYSVSEKNQAKTPQLAKKVRPLFVCGSCLTSEERAVGVEVDHLSCSELIMMDTKIFKIGGKKLRVSVLETTKAAGPLAKQNELVAAMKELKEKVARDC